MMRDKETVAIGRKKSVLSNFCVNQSFKSENKKL